jgi:predicted RNA-binding protein with PIN domain
MKHYIIDGNNLIGKTPSINKLQRKRKDASREKIAFLIGRFFAKRKASVSLHFDGYKNDDIKVLGIRIKYSENQSADQKIKKEIEQSKNPKNIIVVTSDNNVAEFARVCSCSIMKSEEFSKALFKTDAVDEEKQRIDELKNDEEFKKLFRG